jgi:hypothetical protein
MHENIAGIAAEANVVNSKPQISIFKKILKKNSFSNS